jgi:hypothetical protein
MGLAVAGETNRFQTLLRLGKPGLAWQDQRMKYPNTSRPERGSAVVSSFGDTLADGSFVELVADPELRTTALLVGAADSHRLCRSFDAGDGRRLVPPSPRNNLLAHRVVLLPSGADEYGTKSELLSRVLAFLHRYVDLTPVFAQVVAHYVLLTWVYDAFQEVPYLRVRGEPGSGKTRLLRVAGSICCRPIFASGASTVSPIFRLLDSVRGTLVLDEADFRVSDDKAMITKILNNGHAKGFPVLRSEQQGPGQEFNPRAYHVFGPKIVASRGGYDDRALESRFLTELLGTRRLRADVPASLPDTFAEESRRLRNQLLLFRLREKDRAAAMLDAGGLDSVSPRVRQVFGPLLALIDDERVRPDVINLAEQVDRQTLLDRAQEPDAVVLRAAVSLWTDAGRPPSVGQIAAHLARASAIGTVSPRWIGEVLRRKLGLRTERHEQGFALAVGDHPLALRLAERLGVLPNVHDIQDVHTPEVKTAVSPAG